MNVDQIQLERIPARHAGMRFCVCKELWHETCGILICPAKANGCKLACGYLNVTGLSAFAQHKYA